MKKFPVLILFAITMIASFLFVGCEIDLNFNMPNKTWKIAADDNGGDSSAELNDNSFVDIGDEGGQADGQTIPDKYRTVPLEDDRFYTLKRAYDEGLLTKDDIGAIHSVFTRQSTLFEPTLSEDIAAAIKQDWAKKTETFPDSKTVLTADDVVIYKYYGTYNGCVAFLLDYAGLLYPAVYIPVSMEVAEYEFCFGYPVWLNRLLVYKIGDTDGDNGQTDEKESAEYDFSFTISLEKTTFRVDENPIIGLTFSNKSKNSITYDRAVFSSIFPTAATEPGYSLNWERTVTTTVEAGSGFSTGIHFGGIFEEGEHQISFEARLYLIDGSVVRVPSNTLGITVLPAAEPIIENDDIITADDFSLTISMSKRSYYKNENIFVTAELKNLSDTPVDLFYLYTLFAPGLHDAISFPDISLYPITTMKLTLQPGESIAKTQSLKGCFAPGVHVIDYQFVGYVNEKTENNHIVIDSNPIGITVLDAELSTCREMPGEDEKFYYVHRAFDEGLLTKEDIKAVSDRFGDPAKNSPSLLDEDIKESLKRDYAEKAGYYPNTQIKIAPEDVEILKYYGTYNGKTVVLLYPFCDYGAQPVPFSTEICGESFEFDNPDRFYFFLVYDIDGTNEENDGEFDYNEAGGFYEYEIEDALDVSFMPEVSSNYSYSVTFNNVELGRYCDLYTDLFTFESSNGNGKKITLVSSSKSPCYFGLIFNDTDQGSLPDHTYIPVITYRNGKIIGYGVIKIDFLASTAEDRAKLEKFALVLSEKGETITVDQVFKAIDSLTEGEKWSVPFDPEDVFSLKLSLNKTRFFSDEEAEISLRLTYTGNYPVALYYDILFRKIFPTAIDQGTLELPPIDNKIIIKSMGVYSEDLLIKIKNYFEPGEHELCFNALFYVGEPSEGIYGGENYVSVLSNKIIITALGRASTDPVNAEDFSFTISPNALEYYLEDEASIYNSLKVLRDCPITISFDAIFRPVFPTAKEEFGFMFYPVMTNTTLQYPHYNEYYRFNIKDAFEPGEHEIYFEAVFYVGDNLIRLTSNKITITVFEESYPKYVSVPLEDDKFYTVERAFDEGLLTEADIRQVYERFSSQSGRDPGNLDAAVAEALKADWAEKVETFPRYNKQLTPDDVIIYNYYGTYNDCVVFLLYYRGMGHTAEAVYSPITVGGVTFDFGHPVWLDKFLVYRINGGND